MMNFKRVVFIGGNRFGEDGPLLAFLEVCKNKNWDCFLISDKEHLGYPCANGISFEQILKSRNIKFISVESINEDSSLELMKTGDLIVSVSCPWILKEDVINLVRGKIYNYHGSSLPEQRGAGCHSWRMMQGESKFRLTFHHLTEQIDGGNVVYEKDLVSPENCKNLEDTYKFVAEHEVGAFQKFLEKISKNSPDSPPIETRRRKDFYWPRLNTELNGFIDWSWTAEQIVRFCAAFDRPFDGASTFISGVRIRLKKVEIDDTDVNFHPFQFGLIYRITNNAIWVAAKGGGLKINEVQAPKTVNIRLGKRLLTDSDTLIKAKLNLE